MRRALHFIVVGGGPTGARAACFWCFAKLAWLFAQNAATECYVRHLTIKIHYAYEIARGYTSAGMQRRPCVQAVSA